MAFSAECPIVPEGTGCRAQGRCARQHDLIDRETVFAILDADGLGARGCEGHHRSHLPDSPAVVLPSPVGEAAAALQSSMFTSVAAVVPMAQDWACR